MTQALRSPGSTLKPFIYGIGFEDGFIHPETLIEDRPVRYGDYAPENFDLTFQGTVTVRKALQLSLNVPAVAVLDRVGASRLTARLAQAGAPLVLPKGEAPGLAMGLGGVGVRLADLVRLYGGIARLGTTRAAARAGRRDRRHRRRRLMEPVAAWYVAQHAARHAAAGKRRAAAASRSRPAPATAIATPGRSALTASAPSASGSAGRMAAPVPGLVGRAAAAPILFDAFARLGKPLAPLPHAPKSTLFAATAKLPPPLQRFRPAGLPSETDAAGAHHVPAQRRAAGTRVAPTASSIRWR